MKTDKAPKSFEHIATIAGFAISIKRRTRDRYTVVYGLERTECDSYSDAARAVGRAVMHALTCEGRLDP